MSGDDLDTHVPLSQENGLLYVAMHHRSVSIFCESINKTNCENIGSLFLQASFHPSFILMNIVTDFCLLLKPHQKTFISCEQGLVSAQILMQKCFLLKNKRLFARAASSRLKKSWFLSPTSSTFIPISICLHVSAPVLKMPAFISTIMELDGTSLVEVKGPQ